MIYYKNEQTGEVFGFDETDPTQQPYIDKAIEAGYVNITGSYPPPPPPPTAEENKDFAMQCLQKTDWTESLVVADPAQSNPYLDNRSEFIAWRSQVRAIAVTPIGGHLDIFDQMPQEVWKTAN